MTNVVPAFDFAPLGAILLVGIVLASTPLAWALARGRGHGNAGRNRALTLTTLFLTFDLVLFGAYTRLSDSGLGCPDWPGCYGSASPLGATTPIDAAHAALPSGPVSQGKAWIEMAHRYLATAVGVLIAALAALSWRGASRRRRGTGLSPLWPTATLLWVCLQGAFGAWTVTMKLYPAIVTLHLLGGIGLLVLLAIQAEAARLVGRSLPAALAPALAGVAVLALVQIALGGWVSTNYAVLACTDFPTCQGAWWPDMDFAAGFTLRRGLGVAADGSALPVAALTAIHEAHRLGAGVVLMALVALAWAVGRTGGAATRRWAWGLAGVATWQLATGLSNAVLGWPLAAAVAHTGGAAALAAILAVLATRVWRGRRASFSADRPAPLSMPAAS